MSAPDGDDGDEDSPVESPPDGAMCGEHGDRPALAVCPRCGGYACLACWHHPVRRCHACLVRDPAAAAPPVPWETVAPLPVRFARTLLSALRPIASAPAFARGSARSALSFFALSFLPVALLPGVIPFTRHVLFAAPFVVRVRPGVGGAALALDFAQASGLGLLLSLVSIAVLSVPYVTLSHSYAHRGHAAAPARVLLYRGFLLPLVATLGQAQLVVDVGSGADPVAAGALFALGILQVAAFWALFLSMMHTARMGSGAGPFGAFASTALPFVVLGLAAALGSAALAPLLPTEAENRELVTAVGLSP